MNNQDPSIQFTHEHGREEITFLDVTVYKDRDSKLQVKTYIKPTNKQLYISSTSHHPPGAAFGEAIRYLRTNSEKKQFYKMMFLHKRNLLKRGYLRSLINKTMKKVKFSMREESMKPKIRKHQKKTDDRPVFTTRYCSRARKVFRIVEKYWCRLRSDHAGIGTYIKNRPTLAYKSNQNLAKKLVRAKLKRRQMRKNNTAIPNNRDDNNKSSTSSSSSSSSTGTIQQNLNIARLAGITYNKDMGLKVSFKKCGDCECPLHGKVKCTNQARSNISKRAYITRGDADCNTKYVVYLIECRKCGRQYVGQTGQSLRERFSRHLHRIINYNIPSTLHEHFARGACRGAHNVRVQVLQVLDNTGLSAEQTKTELKKIELSSCGWTD